jgi:hypothetical protein
MPKAGFWAIDPTRKISFGKDGWWYANDERIENRRINLLFSQHLRKAEDGSYEIVLGRDRASVEIDDAPYVVTALHGDLDQGLRVRLNDASEEALAPDSLYVGQENVLYCRVKGQEYLARFLRAAYYQIAAYIQEEPETGAFVLRLNDRSYPIPFAQEKQ